MKGFKKRGILKLVGFLLSLTIFSMILIGCGLATNSTSDNSQIGSVDVSKMDSTTPETAIKEEVVPEVQGKRLTMDLFFPEAGNEAVLMEKHELAVNNGAVLRAAIEGLISGPDSGNLIKPIPEGTKLLGINLKNDLAIVDFSKEFGNKNDVAEIAKKISLVNTLTEFTGVNKVKILIEGYEWIAPSGDPYGEMTKIALDAQGRPIDG